MGKVILLFSLLYIVSNAKDVTFDDKQQLQKECLQCHIVQQIPNDFIYRRYLMKYSTFESMHKKMFTYLKNPEQKHSIMPIQFFLKFPMKEPTTLDDQTLHTLINQYLYTFDIKKKLVFP